MLTIDTALGLGDLQTARRVYRAIRDMWVGGGHWLEPHERVGLLTVAAGLRPFSLLNHLDGKLWDSTSAALSAAGLTCAPCEAIFDYELDVAVPDAAIEAYVEHELQHPLRGLGVWSAGAVRTSPSLSELGSALQYPACCTAMDHRAKAHDHAATLQFLTEDGDGRPEAVKAALESGRVPLAWTEEQQDWGKRLDLTRALFPFAVHTACDECIRAGAESPTAALSLAYEQLVLTTSPELHLMVRWACEVSRLSSRNDR